MGYSSWKNHGKGEAIRKVSFPKPWSILCLHHIRSPIALFLMCWPFLSHHMLQVLIMVFFNYRLICCEILTSTSVVYSLIKCIQCSALCMIVPWCGEWSLGHTLVVSLCEWIKARNHMKLLCVDKTTLSARLSLLIQLQPKQQSRWTIMLDVQLN